MRHIKSFVTSSQRIKIRGSTYQNLSIYLPCCIVLYKCCPNVLKCPIKALKNLVKTSRKIQHKTIWYDVVPLVDNKKYPNYVRPYEIFGIYTQHVSYIISYIIFPLNKFVCNEKRLRAIQG